MFLTKELLKPSAELLDNFMNITKPKIIIVDEDDNIIDYKYRDELGDDDIYRVSALWVTNSQGEILIAKRHHTKRHHPNKWGPAVSGTVEQGETYNENIIKETAEEIGLSDSKPMHNKKVMIDNKYHHFTQWYTLKIDKNINDFNFQKNEIEEIKWISPEEIIKQVNEHPEEFTPSMPIILKLFISH